MYVFYFYKIGETEQVYNLVLPGLCKTRNEVNITVINPDTGSFNATDTLFNYCVEVPELGLDSCLYGDVNASDYMLPGEGQLIWNVNVPNYITQLTVNVYYAEGEIDEYSSNNTYFYSNLIQLNCKCKSMNYV